jgi:hypothetical protein
MGNHLAFTAAEELIRKHGNTPEGRQKARNAIAEQVRTGGKQLIERALKTSGRSMKCGGAGGYATPRHAGEDDGCANDGQQCVCQCHDQAGGGTNA